MFLCSHWFLQAMASYAVVVHLSAAVTYAVDMGSIILGCLLQPKCSCDICSVAMFSLFGTLFLNDTLRVCQF